MSHENDEQVWPERTTEQAARYFIAASRTLMLFNLCVDSIIFNDFVSYTAKKALEEDDALAAGKEIQEVPKITPEELARSEPGPRTQALRKYRQELLELFFARSVDSFDTYLVSMIREVLSKQPQILSNSTYNLDIKTILDHDSIDSLVRDLVEKKVSDLSYGGFENLQKWCEKQGIPLTVPAGKLEAVVELIATRNVIAHNRGIIDQKYLGIVKASLFKLGDLRKLNPSDWVRANSLLKSIVEATDQAVAQSFGIEMTLVDSRDNRVTDRRQRGGANSRGLKPSALSVREMCRVSQMTTVLRDVICLNLQKKERRGRNGGEREILQFVQE